MDTIIERLRKPDADKRLLTISMKKLARQMHATVVKDYRRKKTKM